MRRSEASTSPPAWYDVAFDDLYAELYAHRDQAEAGEAVAWLARELDRLKLGLLAGTPVVDLACGTGRHLRALAAAGARAAGVDRSRALLARARRASPERRTALGEIALVAGDLRALPFRSGAFRGALSMFTSLGYFAEEAEHAAAFGEIRRVLAPGAWLVVDFLNAPQVAATLVPESTRALGAYVVHEARRIAGGRIEKEVTVTSAAGGDPVAHYRESVALWTRDELERRLARAGFASLTAAGNYAGEPHTERSPRLLVLAVRERAA